VGMWIEARDPYTLELISGTYLDDLETQVAHPEPRALGPMGESIAFAWAAQRDMGDGPTTSCLYLTPLDALGATIGTSIRIDPGVAEARRPGIEHIRLVVGTDDLYLLWRQDSELWVARVDWSS